MKIKKFSFIFFILFSYGLSLSQDTLWLRRLDRGNEEWGYGITFDRMGNLMVAGVSWNSSTRHNILLIKYTPNGDTIWTKCYGDSESEAAYAVASDQEGNIITAGWSGNDTIESQCLLVKFSPEGNFLWKREYRIRDIDCFTDVAIDRDNGIVLTGTSYTYLGGGDNIGFLRKYDTNGTLVWTKFYPWSDWLLGIVVSQDGNFFVTGIDTFWQIITVRFDSAGDSIWTRKLSWIGHHHSFGCAADLDSFGDIVVVGYTTDWSNYDWVVIKYTQNGDTVWTRRFDFTTGDWATNVTTDHLGNIYVCGNVGVIDTNDYLLAKLTPNGDIIWTRRYDNGYDDKVYGVAVDTNGNPIVTGTSHNGNDYDIVTIKYRGLSGIKEDRQPFNAPSSMLNVYPNPAKSVLAIRLSLSADRQAIKIFDVSGKLIREIATPSAHNGNELKISLKGTKPGIYFLRLGTETKKFLIVK
ncbi:MAG: T9SS type A sorting domain-containing protein [candidate division WOR-3 bacterium]